VIQPGRRIEFPNESSEVLATPETTGDRYRIIGTTPPGGGPGVKGTGLHGHRGLVEVFRCLSGTMTVRVGKDLVEASPGEVVEVPAGIVHGLSTPAPCRSWLKWISSLPHPAPVLKPT